MTGFQWMHARVSTVARRFSSLPLRESLFMFSLRNPFFFFKGYQELFSSIAVELNLPHLGDQTLLSLPLLCTEHYPLWRRGAKSNAEISFPVHVNIV